MANAMGNESITALMDSLRRHRLLEPAQLEELARSRKADGNAHTLARDLVGRGWLTAFQANQLLAGRAASLVLGTYLVIERLGEGATGQVFKARHVHMRRVVAVKVIRPELLTDEEVVARFYREIQVISRLTHPHVVHAYDAGPVGRTHFLVMEFVEGINLADLVQQQGPMPADRASEYVRQAALGLQHAHEKGLVHRDIKPSNLILTQARSSRSLADVDLSAQTMVHGIVKVLDLGLARLPRNTEDPNNPLTQAGKGMMGTPDYLAPEQALDLRQADIRSDLYSLGCVLYFLLSGQPPFPSGTLAQKLMKHQQAPPPPLEKKRPGLPRQLYVAVKRLLAKDPAERYQTPAELAAVLAPLAGASDVGESVIGGTKTFKASAAALTRLQSKWSWLARFRNRRRLVLGLGGGLLLTVFLSGGLLLMRGSSEEFDSPALRPLSAQWRGYRSGDDPEPLRQALLAVQRDYGGSADALRAARMMKGLPSPLDGWNNRPVSSDLPPEVAVVLGEPAGQSWSEVRCLAASPAGKLVASGGADGVVRVWNAETLRETAALRGEGSAIQAVAWSADGQTLAAADAGHSVGLWRPSDGTVQQLAALKLPAASVNGVALAPNGKWLAATNADGKVHLWELAGTGGPKELPALAGPSGSGHAVAFSLDSKSVAAGFANGGIKCWDMTVNPPRERFALKDHAKTVHSISFSGDGKILAASDDREVRLWNLEAAPRSLGFASYKYRVGGVALAPDAKTLAVAVADVVLLVDLAANPARDKAILRGHQVGVNAVSFAPGGKRLFSGGQDRTVRQWDLAAAPPREILPSPNTSISNAALSIDGRVLATQGRSSPFVQLWDIDGASARPREQLPVPSGLVGRIVFASDTKHLAVTTASEPIFWTLEGAKARRLSAPPLGGRGVNLVFAPDGRSAAISQASSTPGVCLWRLNSQPHEGIVLSTAGVVVGSLSFSPDGKELAAVGPPDSGVRFWAVESPAAGLKPIVAEIGAQTSGVGFGPDGKSVLAFNPKNDSVDLYERAALKGKPLLSLGGFPQCRVRSFDVSPDGRTVALAGEGTESLSMWAVSSGKKLASWKLPGPVLSVDFTADGRHLFTLNANGTAYLFRIAPPPGKK